MAFPMRRYSLGRVCSTKNADFRGQYAHAREMQADVEKRFMGTGVEPDVDTAAFMRILELRQGLKIGCPEEVALHLGYIDEKQILRLSDALEGNEYGRYLRELVECPEG
jgi:dTDP-glucose pyrophosphorylase